MCRHSRSQRAFTLVELMAVILIVAMLIALLIPAVSRAREMGRRTTCTNNVYQIAFGMTRLNDSAGYLPGWRNVLVTPSGTIFPSWPVMILPQIDRNDVYKTWAAGAGTAPAISTFICPSSAPDNDSLPALAYAGISVFTAGLLGDAVMTDQPQNTPANRLGLDDIAARDGTTTTLLLAERCGPAAPASTWNAAVLGPLTCAIGIAPTPAMTIPSSSEKIVNNSARAEMPSAAHSGGFVAAFCDGHTAFIKEGIVRHVLTQAMTSNSTWNGSTYPTNSNWVNSWLATVPPGPYALSESDLK